MTGSAGQQRVPSDFFDSYIVFLPELREQQKIAECLSSVDELIAAHKKKLDTIKMHKKGLMQQLFPSADEVNHER